MVSMPVPRTRITATPRDEFQGASEERTHESTYTGFPTAPWGSLPLLDEEQKRDINGHCPRGGAGCIAGG